MNRRHLLVLLTTIIGSGIVILDGTVVNVALPHIARDLHASFSQLQWIVDSYLLSLSALIIVGGSLGDILGRKRMYFTGLVGFGLTSLLCGLAPNINLLIGIRVMQGVFGALLVPGGLAIINTNFASATRARAIGIWSAWAGITTAIGPPLGGYIVDHTTWRWIFFINIPLVVLCWLLGRRSVRGSKADGARRIDYPGALLGSLLLGSTTFGLIEGPAHHWGVLPVSAIILGILSLFAFIKVERRSSDPMVNLSLFKIRNFTGANLMTFAMYGALGGFIFALVLYLQTMAGYSGTKAGFTLLPVTLIMITLSGRMGALCGRFGPRLFMTVGPLIMASGMLFVLPLGPHVHYLTDVFPGVVLFGLGLATTVAPLTITVMGSVPSDQSGIVSGVNNAVARAGSLIVVAGLGLLGSTHFYRFSMTICALLVAGAGVLSYGLIRNHQLKVT